MKIIQLSQETSPKSKFKPEYKDVHIPGTYGYTSMPQPLAPELEAEKQEQLKQMEETLIQKLNLETYPNGRMNIHPWRGSKYDAKAFNTIIMQGVQEGKWDEYLAKKFLNDTQKKWNMDME